VLQHSTRPRTVDWEEDEIWQLIVRKVIKIVATRCQILRLKCTKIYFGMGFHPRSAGGPYSVPPYLLSGIKGTYC